MTTSTAPPRTGLPDIVFPLRTRGDDASGSTAHFARAGGHRESATVAARDVPFLVDRLLRASGPFGLDVEVKSDERVVGTWTIEVMPRHGDDRCAMQAGGNLYICASARCDERANGAFLVVRRWQAPADDKAQLERLYEALSVAVLERLDSLLGGAPNATGDARACVLFLIDGRRSGVERFSLDRLQIRILEDLESDHTIAGIDMRVAHGRGTGTRPHIVFASTLPTSLQSGEETHPGYSRSTPHGSSASEIFVRETLSPENVRWQRRASDRKAGSAADRAST